MIIGQSMNAAVHIAGGVVLGVTTVLAACTLAQLASTQATGCPMRQGRSTPLDPTGRPAGGDGADAV